MTKTGGYALASDKAIREGFKNGTKIATIAAAIDRTVASVTKRARKLGLSHVNRITVYSAADDKIIRRGYARGTAVKKIADKIGRNRTNIIQRAMTLGIKHKRVARYVVKHVRAPKKPAEPQQTPASYGILGRAVEGLRPLVHTAEARQILRSHQGRRDARETGPQFFPIGPALEVGAWRARSCQWIDGEPRADEACKCGEKVEVGSYCLAHAVRSVVKRRPAA